MKYFFGTTELSVFRQIYRECFENRLANENVLSKTFLANENVLSKTFLNMGFLYKSLMEERKIFSRKTLKFSVCFYGCSMSLLNDTNNTSEAKYS